MPQQGQFTQSDLQDTPPKTKGQFTQADLSPSPVVEPEKPGFFKSAGGELMNMVKGIPAMFHDDPDIPGGGPMGSGVKMLTKMVTEDAVRKSDNRSPGYRVAAAIGTPLGINASGMEQAAKKGDTGGVAGIAAADLVPYVAGEAVGPAIDAAKVVPTAAARAITSPFVRGGVKAAAQAADLGVGAHFGGVPGAFVGSVARPVSRIAEAASKPITRLANEHLNPTARGIESPLTTSSAPFSKNTAVNKPLIETVHEGGPPPENPEPPIINAKPVEVKPTQETVYQEGPPPQPPAIRKKAVRNKPVVNETVYQGEQPPEDSYSSPFLSPQEQAKGPLIRPVSPKEPIPQPANGNTPEHAAAENGYFQQARSELGDKATVRDILMRAQEIKTQKPLVQIPGEISDKAAQETAREDYERHGASAEEDAKKVFFESNKGDVGKGTQKQYRPGLINTELPLEKMPFGGEFDKPTNGQGGHAGNGVTSEEEISRPGVNYVLNGNKITYHGKQFAPESVNGGTHVTVLPSGEIRVNAGPPLTLAQDLVLKEALKK